MEDIKNKAHDDELNKSEETIESTPRKRIGVPKPKRKLVTVKVQRLTRKEWIEKNPVILEGVVVYEKDTKRFKMGDGEHAYKDLDYLVDPAVVASWFSMIIDTKIASLKALTLSFVIVSVIYSVLSILFEPINNVRFIFQMGIMGLMYIIVFNIINAHLILKVLK